MDGRDLHDVLSRQLDLAAVLAEKARRAAETGQPFVRVDDLISPTVLPSTSPRGFPKRGDASPRAISAAMKSPIAATTCPWSRAADGSRVPAAHWRKRTARFELTRYPTEMIASRL